jgi:hypothetical protein
VVLVVSGERWGWFRRSQSTEIRPEAWRYADESYRRPPHAVQHADKPTSSWIALAPEYTPLNAIGVFAPATPLCCRPPQVRVLLAPLDRQYPPWMLDLVRSPKRPKFRTG